MSWISTRRLCARRKLLPPLTQSLDRLSGGSQKMKTSYDTDIESNFNSAEEVADKKNIYVTIVGGLVAVAFIAPMLQFFYYTGGD